MSFSRSDVSAKKKHMARVSDLYGERFRSIKTVLFFIVSVSLLSGEAVPTILIYAVKSASSRHHQNLTGYKLEIYLIYKIIEEFLMLTF